MFSLISMTKLEDLTIYIYGESLLSSINLWAPGRNRTSNHQCSADFENLGDYFIVFGQITLWAIVSTFLTPHNIP
jgi:hypothetical protein